MSILILLRPTKNTNISYLIKKPQTEDNDFLIDFHPLSSSRTKSSAASSPIESRILTKILDIKLHIAAFLDIKPDSLKLLSKDSEDVLIELKDNDTFNSSMLNNFKETNAFSPVMFGKYSSSRNKTKVIIYFSLSEHQNKVIIDFFNHNIEKIIFDVSPYCSVYLLKHMINLKTSYSIAKENQILYSVGLLADSQQTNTNNSYQINKMYTAKSPTSHKLTDDTTISQIIEYYNEKGEKNKKHDANQIIHFIFAEKNKDKYQIGLDFSFNIMRTSNKIHFDETAPVYREVSDGLNLFSYCLNSNCSIHKEMFTSTIGYGQFDIIKLCKLIVCPVCKDKGGCEVKNIGMINSQWKYKGFLNGQEASKCEGDGFTIDNKLYVHSEMNIMKQFGSLLIEIKPHSTINKHSVELCNSKDQCSPFEDLDAIDLCTPNEERFDKITKQSRIKHDAPINLGNNIESNSKEDNKNCEIDITNRNICIGCKGISKQDICLIF